MKVTLFCAATLLALVAAAPVSAETFQEFCEQRTASVHPEVTPEEGCSCLAGEVEGKADLEAELGPKSPVRGTGSSEEAAGVLSAGALDALRACGYKI